MRELGATNLITRERRLRFCGGLAHLSDILTEHGVEKDDGGWWVDSVRRWHICHHLWMGCDSCEGAHPKEPRFSGILWADVRLGDDHGG